VTLFPKKERNDDMLDFQKWWASPDAEGVRTKAEGDMRAGTAKRRAELLAKRAALVTAAAVEIPLLRKKTEAAQAKDLRAQAELRAAGNHVGACYRQTASASLRFDRELAAIDSDLRETAAQVAVAIATLRERQEQLRSEPLPTKVVTLQTRGRGEWQEEIVDLAAKDAKFAAVKTAIARCQELYSFAGDVDAELAKIFATVPATPAPLVETAA
jgi:hypothetical protein